MQSVEPGRSLLNEARRHTDSLLLFDPIVAELHGITVDLLKGLPFHTVVADEEHKSIESVLTVVDFLEQHGASRSSMLYVVGGGILQDIGAFAAYMYKRGIPWTFVPTTLLSQSDSCVGGKTAINYKQTKNLLALFRPASCDH
jgi:3-dehydroquinate synthase